MALLAVEPHHDAGPDVVGVVLDPDGDRVEYSDPLPTGEALRRIGDRIGTGIEQFGDIHAESGARLGEVTERVGRRGRSEEVIAPFFVDPVRALVLLSSATFRAEPIDRLRVVEETADNTGMVVWKVRLRTTWFTRRAATLRVYPSPSGNLTIVELLPDRPRWLGARAFVRSGVRSVDHVGERLVHTLRNRDRCAV